MDHPSSSASVSVVIPTRGRPELLKRCLQALTDQEYPADRFEVVVVEDGGPGPAGQVVGELAGRPTMRYVPVPRGGPAAARNAGWRLARGEIVAFTDDDTVPDRRWIAEAVRSFADGADAVSGRTIVPIPPRPTDAQRNTRGLEQATFATCNAFCRRGWLERVGGFDPRFTRAYREDSDLEFTLLDAGAGIVHNDAAIVYHPPRAERPFVSLKHQRNQFFDPLLYRKHRRRFRGCIRAAPPWRHYAITAAQAASLLGLVVGHRSVARVAGIAWISMVGHFCVQRLRGADLSVDHVAEMALTSVLIPPLAIYWRLRGAWAFRVPFL